MKNTNKCQREEPQEHVVKQVTIKQHEPQNTGTRIGGERERGKGDTEKRGERGGRERNEGGKEG